MNILLTGAAGQLGSTVHRHLLATGHQVRATDLQATDNAEFSVETADLAEPGTAGPLVKGVDAVVHLGNIPNQHVTDPHTTYRINTSINIHVLQAAAEAGVRHIIFASSVQVVSGSPQGKHPPSPPYLPFDGETPPCPGSTYALSKQAGENALRYYADVHGISATAFRFPWLAEAERIEEMLQRSKGSAGSTTKSVARNRGEGFGFLCIDDAATLIEAALRRPPSGYRCFMPADRRTRLYPLLPSEIVARHYPGVLVRKDLDALGALVDLDEIREAFGWEPPKVSASISSLTR